MNSDQIAREMNRPKILAFDSAKMRDLLFWVNAANPNMLAAAINDYESNEWGDPE